MLSDGECRLGLRVRVAAEARGKPPALGRLHGGSRGGGSPSRGRLQSQLLLARQIALLRALLALEQAVLRLQQSLLLALRPRALWILRLQLLHMLLQAIDAGLTLPGLARKRLALSFLYDLLPLLDVLLTLLLSRQPLAQGGRRVGARGCGDMGLRSLRHGGTLRQRHRTTMELGPRSRNARCNRVRRCGEVRHRTRRRHRRTLGHRRGMERRCGRPCHCCRRR